MNTETLYKKISDQLHLSAEQQQDLRDTFTDPNELGELDDTWDGNDVCDHFDRERRGNRNAINAILVEYKMSSAQAEERVPYSQLDGE